MRVSQSVLPQPLTVQAVPGGRAVPRLGRQTVPTAWDSRVAPASRTIARSWENSPSRLQILR